MSNKTRILELEIQVGDLSRKIEQANKEKEKLSRDLDSARVTISRLTDRVASFHPEEEKKQVAAEIAKLEGLRALYQEKLNSFDEEQAHVQAVFDGQDSAKRQDLANEVQARQQANEDEMASTIQDFSETYNSYLHQMKRLMDCLSEVAVETGKTLFTSSPDALRSNLGHQMVARLSEYNAREQAALAAAEEEAAQAARAAQEQAEREAKAAEAERAAEEARAAGEEARKVAEKAAREQAKQEVKATEAERVAQEAMAAREEARKVAEKAAEEAMAAEAEAKKAERKAARAQAKKNGGKKSHAAIKAPEGPVQDHLGNEYPSLGDMLDAYHLVPRTYNYRKNLGWSLQECLEGHAR